MNISRYIISFGLTFFSNTLTSHEQIFPNPKKCVEEEAKIFEKFSSILAGDKPEINEEIFEWVDILEAIDTAKDQFVMLEVGAGYGRWGARAGTAAESQHLPYHIVFIEGEPYRTEIAIHEEMKKNNIPWNNYRIISACVGPVNKNSFFYIDKDNQTLENWFGQCIMLNGDKRAKSLKEKYYGCPLILTTYGYRAVLIQQKKLSEILNSVQYPIIDICDFDIQGMEFEVIQESIEILNNRVKCLHIGTHSQEIEINLKNLLHKNGWRLIRNYQLGQTNQTPYGEVLFVDGVQTWHNEKLINYLSSRP